MCIRDSHFSYDAPSRKDFSFQPTNSQRPRLEGRQPLDAVLQKCQEIYLAAKALLELNNLVMNRVIPSNPVAKEMLKGLGNYRESEILPGDF